MLGAAVRSEEAPESRALGLSSIDFSLTQWAVFKDPYSKRPKYSPTHTQAPVNIKLSHAVTSRSSRMSRNGQRDGCGSV